MRPGPDRVIECPECGALHRVFSLLSGNTFGATYYSDGKMIAPMMPEPPRITRCDQCRKLFWVAEARQIGEISPHITEEAHIEEDWKYQGADKAWISAPQVSELSEEEFFEAIEGGFAVGTARERDIRILTWWRSNDLYRSEDAESEHRDVARAPRAVSNMEKLFKLLDADDPRQRIMKAEVARHLRNFDVCISLLEGLDNGDYDRYKGTLLELALNGSSRLSRI